MDLANDQMWGKGGKVTLVTVDGENFYAIRSYREDSRSDLGDKMAGSWVLFDIFYVSDTDRSSGNLNLVLRRNHDLRVILIE